MVQLRKLTLELINYFPDPSAEPVVQTKDLIKTWPVFEALFWCQIVPKSAKSCQKLAKRGRKSRVFGDRFY
jgi:hypothetical protein